MENKKYEKIEDRESSLQSMLDVFLTTSRASIPNKLDRKVWKYRMCWTRIKTYWNHLTLYCFLYDVLSLMALYFEQDIGGDNERKERDIKQFCPW